jgi:hypothetical protein
VLSCEFLAADLRTWRPEWIDAPLIRNIVRDYYGFRPPVSREEIPAFTGRQPVLRLERDGLWIYLFRR